jgi:Peptidase family M28
MIKHIILVTGLLLATLLFIGISISAADAEYFISDSDFDETNIYRVEVNSVAKAEMLTEINAHAILRLRGGYLILTDVDTESRLLNSNLKYTLVATDVSLNNLVMDHNPTGENIGKYPLVFEEDNLRLYEIEPHIRSAIPATSQLHPVRTKSLNIVYNEPRSLNMAYSRDMIALDSLRNLIIKDSLISYTERLQAFGRRDAVSDSNYASRDWLATKFSSFGYDSIVIDSFTASIYTLFDQCQNVLAYKVGTLLPDHHIIIGAHRDAVSVSPGADDNGTGTAAVLEIARILKDIETNVTIVFALFDAEENGLIGAWHYADEAAARGDSLIYMLNMDMIGFIANNAQAELYHGSDLTYTLLWQSLADSLAGISAVLAGQSSYSDHHAFDQNGFKVTFAAEYEFSTVYHTYQDSTTYLSFKYMTRMTKASLLTAYVASQTYTPFSLEFTYLDSIPEYLSYTEATEIDMLIDGITGGTVVPGSAVLHYSVNGSAYTDKPLVHIDSNHYRAEFPQISCNSYVSYYFSAEEAINGIIYSPDPESPFQSTIIADIVELLNDDFESDLGWTVNGDAYDGHWERGVPIGGGDRGDPPTDFDGSGSCFLTKNEDGNSDVDNGITNLISPVFDLSSASAKIHYARWFSNYLGYATDDVFDTYISNDNGESWVLVDRVGPHNYNTGGWYEHTFWVSDFVTSTDQMLLRFQAADIGTSSTVEAAIDDVQITSFICPDVTCGDANGDITINVSDAVFIINFVFVGGDAPDPYGSGDTNCDYIVNVSDAVYIINYIFLGANPPCDLDGNGAPDC